MSLKVSVPTLRCIDKAGGLDNYIIDTPERTLHSKLAIDLKILMVWVVKCKEEGSGVRFFLNQELVIMFTFQKSIPTDFTLIGKDLADRSCFVRESTCTDPKYVKCWWLFELGDGFRE